MRPSPSLPSGPSHPRPRPRTGPATALLLLILSHTSSAASATPSSVNEPAPSPTPAGSTPEIVVTTPRGSAGGGIDPVLKISPSELDSYGADSLSDLVEDLRPLTPQ